MEADEADDDAFTARIDAAIKKHSGTTTEILAAAVAKTAEVAKKMDSTEQEAKDSQKAAKLSSIMGRISLSKKQKKVIMDG